MKRILALFCVLVILSMLFVPALSASAVGDPLTASAVASASYALMYDWGIGFTAGTATGTGMSDFMTQQVEDYVEAQGSSISSLFVGEIYRDIAGKLVVAQGVYNGIKDFVGWLQTKFGIGQRNSYLSKGMYGGEYVTGQVTEWDGEHSGACYFTSPSTTWIPGETCYGLCYYLLDGIYTAMSPGAYNLFSGNYYIDIHNNSLNIYVEQVTQQGVITYRSAQLLFLGTGTLPNALQWNGTNYVEPTVLNPGKAWAGTVPNAPDTNLDQMLEGVNNNVASNDVVVDDTEIIDVEPAPTPVPTYPPVDPDTPLSEVPWGGLNDLGDQLTGSLEDAIGGSTDTLEGAIEGQTGVVTGAIDQAISDVQDAIREQTNTLKRAEEATTAAVESIEGILTDETINWQKFDLRGLFPFCIPFDIYNMLNALDATPIAPHVTIPIVIESFGFSYNMDLDFSVFNPVAQVLRTMELICYGIGLAWATSKVIKW